MSTISPGDELAGLARAFMYAGTPSVLASLWKVDDYYTEKLMVCFYRAPFVLIGDFRQEGIKTLSSSGTKFPS